MNDSRSTYRGGLGGGETMGVEPLLEIRFYKRLAGNAMNLP